MPILMLSIFYEMCMGIIKYMNLQICNGPEKLILSIETVKQFNLCIFAALVIGSKKLLFLYCVTVWKKSVYYVLS